MGDTQHNSSLWSLPVSLQNLIWFPMQQDKNHIKLQGEKKKPNPQPNQLCYTQDLHLIPNFLHSQCVCFADFHCSRTFIPSLCTATACLAVWDWSRQVWKNHIGLNIIRLTLKAQELTSLRKQLPIFPWGSDLGAGRLGRERKIFKKESQGGWVFVVSSAILGEPWGYQDVRNYEELNSYEKPQTKPKPKLRKHNESSACWK